ncbi:unnamed protein product [Schistocephalus solidus]|uniref:Protein LTV1 homolog n=1 Tax=Schistocephalus solidus TaxID=70667 RepID=A0A3P7CFN4_SCHSO|nr:unnamed protein product [Schistocephalus solidus]
MFILLLIVQIKANRQDQGQKNTVRKNHSTKDVECHIPGVPECYNYGIYLDDGSDYLKYLKSMKEFVEDPEYEVMDDLGLPEDYQPPEVQPVTPPLVEDFEIPSDEELLEEQGELEDNFLELAGGPHVRSDNEEEEEANDDHNHSSSHFKKPIPPPTLGQTSNLQINKVKMMERFLFGSESADTDSFSLEHMEAGQGTTAPSTTTASIRKGRPLNEQEELLEKQFDRLLRKSKSRTGFDGRSVMSGVSVMSESLQSAVQGDELMLQKRCPKNDDLGKLDSEAKSATLRYVAELPEHNDAVDPLQQWIGPPKPDVGSITLSACPSGDVIQPPLLQLPRKSGSRKSNPSKHETAPASDESDEESDDDEEEETLSAPVSMSRMKNETPEERKARKNALKAYKRERKQIKKYNKLNFRKDLLNAKATGQIRISHLE